ncbi:hypothetical protein KP509_23G027100 [Ceratopteris richardii]|nr:hypothetical protein KP509_23G027100 [Ceratopteris richardii]
MQNINLGDFPALVNSATQSDVDDIQPQKSIGVEDLFSIKPYTAGGGHRNTTATDFATIVRKNTSSTPTSKGEQNRTVRSERSSCYGDYPTKSAEKFGGSNPTRARHSAPVWLETGEAVSNMYADHREEARNHARIRNAYFEQARQAYLSGNKALARELSAEGQKHNDRMKEAHNRACEAIFQQRNMSVGSYDNGQSPILDLHGLHVSEAIPLLKRELAAFRAIARSSHQRLQVLICVGTGHHTKGAKTPARLPVAVEKFLTEDVRLSYTEQKPGMLMVVLS